MQQNKSSTQPPYSAIPCAKPDSEVQKKTFTCLEHNLQVILVCFNNSCKEDRLQCIQCIKKGMHVSHPQDQENFDSLIHYVNKNEYSYKALIRNLIEQMGLAREQFDFLIEGIKKKYQISYSSLQYCNSIKVNSFLSDILQFKSFEQTLQIKIQQSFQEFKDQIEILYFDLKLSELNYACPSKYEKEKSQKLYQEGNKCIKLGFKLYSKNDFKEAIKLFDKSIIYDPKNQSSLQCKGDSLRQLNMFKEAIDAIEKSLSINPNHFQSLMVKGQCLEDQKYYQEALTVYEKALKINPIHKQTKDRKAKCLEALNQI